MYTHDFSPFAGFLSPGLVSAFVPLVIAIALWVIVLKGFALWYSARAGQRYWFIALLVLNTLGILELVYLIWFRPKGEASPSATPEVSSAPQGQEQK